jgi:methyltransferase (TIGR00027 family)
MRPEGSRTAESSAAQRALHTLHAHEPKIFTDPFALGLAGPTWRWIVGPRPMARLFEKTYGWLMPMVGHHLARARYVEERLDVLRQDGLRQYVLLGAGMDSFALRRPELSSELAVFEVDHPGTQSWKRARLEKLGHGEPSHVEYVGVDFETESLAEGLQRSDFNREALTLFAWMGVIPYLTEESIIATLRDVAMNAPSGSELVFDTLDRAAFVEGKKKPVGRKMFAATEKWGEPMLTGYDPPELEGLLAEAGLTLVEVMSPAEFTDRWFSERADRLEPWEHMYVVRARVS